MKIADIYWINPVSSFLIVAEGVSFSSLFYYSTYDFFLAVKIDKDDYGITDIGDGYIPETLNSSTAENSNIDNDAKIKSQSSSESKEIALGCFELGNKELMTERLPKPKFDDYLVCFTTLKGNYFPRN